MGFCREQGLTAHMPHSCLCMGLSGLREDIAAFCAALLCRNPEKRRRAVEPGCLGSHGAS